MRKGNLRRAAALVGVGLAAAAWAATWERPDELKTPPLKWEIPRAERFVLDNSLVVYLQPDRELPLVNIGAVVRTGSIYLPADKVGLAGLTGTVMRTGGTAAPGRGRGGDEVDAALEYRAAVAETNIGRDVGTVQVRALAKDTDFALEMLHDILRYPAFEEKKVEEARLQALEALRRQNDQPEDIAWREFPKVVYGADSPWARTPTAATLAALTRDDLVAFHRLFFRPQNVILTVYGDFEPRAMKEKVTRLFGAWPREEAALPAVAPVAPTFEPGVYLAAKEGTQSNVLLGHYGVRRLGDDEFPILVMNMVMSGGFGTRMVSAIRSDRGLAYHTWAWLGDGTDLGLFFAYCATKTESTAEAVGVMRDVVASMGATPPTPVEMTRARDTTINRFVFTFAGRAALVNTLATQEYYGFPPDYLEKYCGRVAAVTAEEVTAAAVRRLHVDGLKIFVVGDPALAADLAAFGPVEEIPLSNE